MSLTRVGMLLASLCAGAGGVLFTLAQEPATIKVDVSVVNVLATVRDRNGRLVNDLSRDDFILEEEGKRQEIRYFSRQTELPLTIGLLVDTSMSQRNLIEEERSASYQFFDQVLRPDRDQAFVIKFDVEVELLQDLTNSRGALRKALNALQVPASFRQPATGRTRSNRLGISLAQRLPGGIQIPGGQRRPGGGKQGRPGPGGPGGMPGIGTLLFDAVYLASEEVLQQQEGRKAIILISDGVDHGSKVGDKDAIEAAHRADTLTYSIRYYDPAAYAGPGGRGGRGRSQDSHGSSVLKALSKETGGRMFEVSKKLTLKEIYDRIQEELRNQYNLGYTPTNGSGAGFRRIRLRTTDGKLEVATRAGYYPKRS